MYASSIILHWHDMNLQTVSNSRYVPIYVMMASVMAYTILNFSLIINSQVERIILIFRIKNN